MVSKPKPESDRQKTYFFPTPGSKSAIAAARENHARQLNVHGLPSEFRECSMGGVQDNALFQLFMKLGKNKIGRQGIDIGQHQIVGARPVKQTSSHDKSPTMRVTVDSSDTKERIIKATTIANVWGYKCNATFLRDVPPEKKSPSEDRKQLPKRKRRSSQEDNNKSKKSKMERENSEKPPIHFEKR